MSIPALLGATDPAAITGFVIALSAYAVDCKAKWWFTHIGKKVFEAALPPVAYGNSSSSVVFPRHMSRVGTAFSHASPAVVGRRQISIGTMSMRANPCFIEFAFEASARAGIPGSYARQSDCAGISAVAFSQPTTAPVAVPAGMGKGDKSPEPLTCDIHDCGHCGSFHERLCQGAARRFSGGPFRIYTRELPT
jgi:hypothetical protein